MNLARVLLGRRRPTNDGAQGDQRRLVGDGLGALDGGVKLGDIFDVVAGLLPVDYLGVPAVSLVTLRQVFGECDVGVTTRLPSFW